jgi:4-hydroxy-tetrahydrodipicolinate reductase
MIRVAVAGALGRMGAVVSDALCKAEDIEYVGGLVRSKSNPVPMLYDDVEALIATAKPNVLVDFTTHPSTVEVSMKALRKGVRLVIGATGWSEAERTALEREAEERRIGAMLVPNFSLGAALMMRFAAEAAPYFPTVEIVEMHHDEKKDKPSGTAVLTAERIVAAGGFGDVPMHSIRLRGLVAHHQVMFGGDGETLTIRHDSLSREGFVAGVLAAVRAVMRLDKLAIGLDSVLPDLAKKEQASST